MQTQTSIPPLPEPPHCVSFFRGDTCDQNRVQYQQQMAQRAQAILQAQKEAGAQEASAQLQPQIDQLRTQLSGLQREKDQLQQRLSQQAADNFQRTNAMHDEGFRSGVELGLGIAIAFALALGILVKLFGSRFTISKKATAQTASN